LNERSLRIVVLAGGPDAEREVSFKSGASVTAALRDAGHTVAQYDISPTDLTALETFAHWPGDVIFPVLHGPWGEGGALQQILEQRGLPYVGSDSKAAARCMDKYQTKQTLEQAGIPTPAFELLQHHAAPTLEPPAVVKPANEGSSIALSICHDASSMRKAIEQTQQQYEKVLLERFTRGREITVGVLQLAEIEGERNNPASESTALTALPPLQITPAASHYDYAAKYERDDTQYSFEIDLPASTLEALKAHALAAHRRLGVAHLSRVDFIVDEAGSPWLLEVNTLPGFTDHSLLPMAAAEAGLPMAALCDRLARAAARTGPKQRTGQTAP
jgi:D-alanine-D-alanine ligase